MRSPSSALLLFLCACGPVTATSVIGDAEIAASRAHASDGDKLAAYETTSADLYLQKAKEAQGQARYGAAIELARTSLGFADAAALKSAQQRTGTVPLAPGGAITRPVQGVSSPPAAAPSPPPAAAPSPPPAAAPSPPPAAAPSPTRAEPARAPPRQVILPAGSAPAVPPAPPEGKQPIDPERP